MPVDNTSINFEELAQAASVEGKIRPIVIALHEELTKQKVSYSLILECGDCFIVSTSVTQEAADKNPNLAVACGVSELLEMEDRDLATRAINSILRIVASTLKLEEERNEDGEH